MNHAVEFPGRTVTIFVGGGFGGGAAPLPPIQIK
jgi:hypothetical protein